MIIVIVRPYNNVRICPWNVIHGYHRYVIYIGSTKTGGNTREKRNLGSENSEGGNERPPHEGHGGHDRCQGNVQDL